jgi:hypothetical protein
MLDIELAQFLLVLGELDVGAANAGQMTRIFGFGGARRGGSLECDDAENRKSDNREGQVFFHLYSAYEFVEAYPLICIANRPAQWIPARTGHNFP